MSPSPLIGPLVDLSSTPPRVPLGATERLAMSENGKHPESSHSMAGTSLSSQDVSLSDRRLEISLNDVDPPASPNGSSALFEAVAAALPPV